MAGKRNTATLSRTIWRLPLEGNAEGILLEDEDRVGRKIAGLALHQAGGLQGRRDDWAGRNARRRVGRLCGELGNGETCCLKGRCDNGVGIECITSTSLFTLGKQGFG
jgi:hypothetical protein